jgi:hypothetical protein
MDIRQRQELTLSELTARVSSFCEVMDPGHLINRLEARDLSAELVRRSSIVPRGAASDELAARQTSIVEALNDLVKWGCGF